MAACFSLIIFQPMLDNTSKQKNEDATSLLAHTCKNCKIKLMLYFVLNDLPIDVLSFNLCLIREFEKEKFTETGRI